MTEAELLADLRGRGLRRIAALTFTRNRSTMISWRGDRVRLHEGYADAWPDVFDAIVRFVEARQREARRQAVGMLMAFERARGLAAASRRRRLQPIHPEDTGLVSRLAMAHVELNRLHFDRRLGAIRIVVSRRLRRRLGHYAIGSAECSAEIVISRRHIRRDGWTRALGTLLHEMVHQWQDETGSPIDHGVAFRRMAREVGIQAHAVAFAD